MSIPGFDFSTVNVVHNHHTLDIVWEMADEGSRAEPSIPETRFSLAGLEFSIQIALIDEQHSHPYGFLLQLDDACARCLAEGWSLEICMKYYRKFDDGQATSGDWKGWFKTGVTNLRFFRFNSNYAHFMFDWNVTAYNFHPYQGFFLDRSLAERKRADCTVILEGEEDAPVFVNKSVLATDSPYFQSMFFGEFKEKNQDTIAIAQASVSDFLEYLYQVYAPNRHFTLARMEPILRLADLFGNDLLLRNCELYLLKRELKEIPDKAQVIEWANDYRMASLFRQTLDRMNKEELKSLSPSRLSHFHEQNVEAILEKSFQML